MSRAAANTARYEDRMKAKGFVRKHVWVPVDKAGEVEALADKLRRAATWDTEDVALERDRIITTLRASHPILKTVSVEHVILFGSFARGDAQVESDVDLQVSFAPHVERSFELLNLTSTILREILGRKVDVLSSEKPKESLALAIARDGIKVF